MINLPKALSLESIMVNKDFYPASEDLESGTFDLLVVDPPYGTLKTVDWDKPLDWELTEKVFADLLAPTGQAIIFSNLKLMLEILNTFGQYLELKHLHIAYRSSALPSSQYTPIPNADFILIIKKVGVKASQLVFNPRETLNSGKPYKKRNYQREVSIRQERKPEFNVNATGSRYISQIIKSTSKPNMVKEERTKHPTQKSLILMRELIRVYSNPGQLIVSPFAGSGTDLIAAEMEGRRSVGFELNRDYYEEAIARIAQYRAQGDLFSGDVS
jgi:site-specific DNA-methyltransferase (adenine-specific)